MENSPGGSRKAKTILVTGAHGYVASHLIRRLAASGRYEIVTTGRRTQAPQPLAHLGCRYIQTDLADPAGMEGLGAIRYDAIFHLAGRAIFQEDFYSNLQMYRSNVTSTFLLSELAREHGSRFFFLSTGMVYGNQPSPFREDQEPRPVSFYGLSKLMAEDMIRSYSLHYSLKHLVLRTSIIYGPGQGGKMLIPSMVNTLAKGEPFPMTAGKQLRDFLYIDDCTHALELALDSGIDGIYNLAHGSSVTLAEAAKLAGEVTGAADKIQPGALPYRPNELWEYSLDVDRIRVALKWSPEVGLREGLERSLEYAKRHGI